MKKKKKETRGGARPGAGRKGPGYETITLSFRVPVDKAEVLKIKIDSIIKKEVSTYGFS